MNSMTGFGSARISKDGRDISIEIKSVNHKFLDLSFKMPRSLSYLEDSFRNELAGMLSRGHVDVFVTYKNTRRDSKEIVFDDALVAQILTASRAASEKHGVDYDMTVSKLFTMQDVVTVTEAEDDRDAVSEIAISAVRSAITELINMREREGQHLYNDISEKITTLQSIRDDIDKYAPSVVAQYAEKLSERIKSLLNGKVEIDESRLATEVAIFADKASIDEELVRIKTHLSELRKFLSSNEPVGRKCDFLVQELNREFNTIGSKANDSAIARLVIEAKAEIEKIREQVQNIE